MLTQAQNAKEALERAGLKWRKDFRVTTERIMNGKTFVGYGDVSIVILNLGKAIALIEAMRYEGLSIVLYPRKTMTLVYVFNDGKGSLKTEEMPKHD